MLRYLIAACLITGGVLSYVASTKAPLDIIGRDLSPDGKLEIVYAASESEGALGGGVGTMLYIVERGGNPSPDNLFMEWEPENLRETVKSDFEAKWMGPRELAVKVDEGVVTNFRNALFVGEGASAKFVHVKLTAP